MRMRVVIINPNTTSAMTNGIRAAATAVAAPDTEIVAVNPEDGPESIEGFFDEALSVPGALHEIRKHANADAFIIACFDDVGLEAARSLTSAPTIGIGEAAFHMASMVAHRFGVVTAVGRAIAAIENNLAKYGLASRCSGVRAIEVPVLALETEGPSRVEQEIQKAIAADGAEAIVLGCAGMARLVPALSAKFGIPVLDGIACAVKLAEAMVGVGMKTSKLGTYSTPRPKRHGGMFSSWSAHR